MATTLNLQILRQANEDCSRIGIRDADLVPPFEAVSWALQSWTSGTKPKPMSWTTDILKDTGFRVVKANGRLMFSTTVGEKKRATDLMFVADKADRSVLLIAAAKHDERDPEARMLRAVADARLDSLRTHSKK